MSGRLAQFRQNWPWYTQQLRRRASDAWGAIARIGAELLVSAAVLGGWALGTVAVARVMWLPLRPAVWPASASVLLLSLAGWKFLGRLAGEGLYALTREDERRG